MNPSIRERLNRERVRKLKCASVRLEPAILKRLETIATENGTTLGGVVRVAVERFVEESDASDGARANVPSAEITQNAGRSSGQAPE